MKNKYNNGDIVYSVGVDKNLIINVNKMIVDSLFFNSNLNKYNYSCIGLENKVIRDYELPETEDEKKDAWNIIRNDKNPGMTTQSSGIESSYCSKEELENTIQEKLQKKIAQLKKEKEAADKFKCPLTGAKIIRRPPNMYVLDGPSYYDVEGKSVVWERYPRDWNPSPFHTIFQGKEYVFEYLGDGNWRELDLIKGDNNGGMYVDKALYESKDEKVLQEVEEFLKEQRDALKKWEERKKEHNFNSVLFPLMKRVYPTLVKNELVEVKPMSAPTGVLNYVEYPKVEKLRVEIIGEGEYEIEAAKVKAWKLELIDGGYMFGNTLIKILE